METEIKEAVYWALPQAGLRYKRDRFELIMTQSRMYIKPCF